jgi:hypothetical protein
MLEICLTQCPCAILIGKKLDDGVYGYFLIQCSTMEKGKQGGSLGHGGGPIERIRLRWDIRSICSTLEFRV